MTTILTKRQKQLRRKYTSAHGNEARLTIGVQSFALCSACAGTRRMAAWYRDMLAVALESLLQGEAQS
jgi:hypothetical protein